MCRPIARRLGSLRTCEINATTFTDRVVVRAAWPFVYSCALVRPDRSGAIRGTLDAIVPLIETELRLLSVPEVPRRGWFRISPKAEMRMARSVFRGGVGDTIDQSLRALILFLVPRESGFDLVKTHDY